MAKVKIKNRAAVQKGIAKSINGFINDADSMNRVNRILVSELKDELADPKNQKKQISKEWEKQRASLARVNKTSKYFSPARSNVHFTGNFVSSLTGKFKGKGEFDLYYDGDHKPYKLIKGGRTKRVSNSKIAEGLQSKGFRVFFLPRKKAPERILNIFKRYLRRIK